MCFCGNSYGKFEQKPLEDCNKKCYNQGPGFCGGSSRNAVYDLSKVDLRPCSRSKSNSLLQCMPSRSSRMVKSAVLGLDWSWAQPLPMLVDT